MQSLLSAPALEELAREYLAAGGVERPPVPSTLVTLFDPDRAIRVQHSNYLGADHGLVWDANGCWRIIVNALHQSWDRRFTIFHEGAHILYRRQLLPVGITPGDGLEQAADAFALAILMPRDWLLPRLAEPIDQLATEYRVSWWMMAQRLGQLGREFADDSNSRNGLGLPEGAAVDRAVSSVYRRARTTAARNAAIHHATGSAARLARTLPASRGRQHRTRAA